MAFPDRATGSVVEQGSIPRSIGDQNMEMELVNSTVSLGRSLAEPLVKFLHILMDKLILMMVKPPIISGNIGQYLI